MMLRLLVVWLINALALIAVAYLMPSITVSSFGAALVAALVLGLINAVVRPVLVLLTLPVTLLTLGLFIFVLNGLLFWMVGSWLEGFGVGGGEEPLVLQHAAAHGELLRRAVRQVRQDDDRVAPAPREPAQQRFRS